MLEPGEMLSKFKHLMPQPSDGGVFGALIDGAKYLLEQASDDQFEMDDKEDLIQKATDLVGIVEPAN